MDVTIKVCNHCKSPTRGTMPYTITQGGRTVEVDLCSEDGKPFEAYLPGRTGRKPSMVSPLDSMAPANGNGSTATTPIPRKRTAKKAAAKKSTAGRRTRKTTQGKPGGSTADTGTPSLAAVGS